MKYFARHIVSATLTALFGIIAITGILMFFKIRFTGSEALHIWLGLAFVGVAGIHLLKNWATFANHFKKKSTLYSVISVVIIGSLFVAIPLLNPAPKGANPKAEVFRAMNTAPLATLAQFVKKDEKKMLENLLVNANISATAEQSIAEIARKNNKKNDEILQIVFLEPSK